MRRRDRLLDTLPDEVWLGKRPRLAREGHFLLEPFRRPSADEALFDMLDGHARGPTVRVG